MGPFPALRGNIAIQLDSHYDVAWYRDHIAIAEEWLGGRCYTIGPRGGLRRTS
jgi:hypothetical protein